MTAADFTALVAAAAPSLTPEQRALAARFVGALAGAPNAARADAHRGRRELERAWEETQLSGEAVERRRREPA